MRRRPDAGCQRGQQQLARRVGDARAAQGFQQDELDRPALVLLVDFHQLDPARGAAGPAPRPAGRPPAPARARAATAAASTRPRRLRQVGRHHHAAADRLAVQPGAVAHAGLDRVAEGVAEVEHGAQAAFALVAAHHVGLDLARARDRVRQRAAWSRATSLPMFASIQSKKRGVEDGAVLDHFGQAGRQLARAAGCPGWRCRRCTARGW